MLVSVNLTGIVNVYYWSSGVAKMRKSSTLQNTRVHKFLISLLDNYCLIKFIVLWFSE